MRQCAISITLASIIIAISMLTANGASAWNYKAIKWHGYNAGLNAAKRQGKPVLIVFEAKWCKICRRYQKLFYDKRVVQKSKKLIMIKIDIDRNKKLQKHYSFDGGYIPRTMVLNAAGRVHEEIYGSRSDYKYFLNTENPGELLSVMDRAVAWQ